MCCWVREGDYTMLGVYICIYMYNDALYYVHICFVSILSYFYHEFYKLIYGEEALERNIEKYSAYLGKLII